MRDQEWIEWANAVFCSGVRNGSSGPRGGFATAKEVRDWLAARLNRRARNAKYHGDDVPWLTDQDLQVR